jgi:hypothetical protein
MDPGSPQRSGRDDNPESRHPGLDPGSMRGLAKPRMLGICPAPAGSRLSAALRPGVTVRVLRSGRDDNPESRHPGLDPGSMRGLAKPRMLGICPAPAGSRLSAALRPGWRLRVCATAGMMRCGGTPRAVAGREHAAGVERWPCIADDSRAELTPSGGGRILRGPAGGIQARYRHCGFLWESAVAGIFCRPGQARGRLSMPRRPGAAAFPG